MDLLELELPSLKHLSKMEATKSPARIGFDFHSPLHVSNALRVPVVCGDSRLPS